MGKYNWQAGNEGIKTIFRRVMQAANQGKIAMYVS
jgi:hypothetical protein